MEWTGRPDEEARARALTLTGQMQVDMTSFRDQLQDFFSGTIAIYQAQRAEAALKTPMDTKEYWELFDNSARMYLVWKMSTDDEYWAAMDDLLTPG
jgi:hypothetical protein